VSPTLKYQDLSRLLILVTTVYELLTNQQILKRIRFYLNYARILHEPYT